MRGTLVRLGEYNRPRLLQGVVDYLKTQHIDVTIRVLDGQTAELWVQDRHLEKALPIWQQFIRDPHAQQFQDAAWALNQTSPLFTYPSSSLNLMSRAKALDPFVFLTALICFVTFFSLHLVAPEATFHTFQFEKSNAFHWFSPVFLHFDVLHLVFNLMWWIYLGDKIAKQFSQLTLITLFACSALASNWMQYLIVDANFGGMSGVVYALCGFLWLNHSRYPHGPMLLPKAMIGLMLVWMLVGFADILYVSMANWAHLFGLIVGGLLGWGWGKPSGTST